MKKILLLIALVLLVCCKARKLDKQVEETDKKIDKTEKTTLAIEDKSSENKKETNQKEQVENQVNTTSKSVLKAKPLNPDKPIDVVDSNGKITKYYNAEIEVENSETRNESNKKTEEKQQVEEKKDNNISQNFNQEKKDNSKIKGLKISKKLDAKPVVATFYIWIFWIVLLILLIWFLRKKIPFIKTFFV